MINTLTSLRIFFALMVFGAHCYVLDTSFDAHFFKEGFVGVSFFFVLSGFIIAYNYQEKLLTKTTTKRTFWVARIARIYPLHLLTLLIAACIGGYVQYSDTTDWIKHFVASTFLLQPFFPSADYFFSFNSPSWSLGCEQLFYFCFPLIIPFLNKQQAKTIGCTLNLSSGHAGRYVSDCRRTNQSILVCQSHHPPAGFFCGSITLSDLSVITQ